MSVTYCTGNHILVGLGGTGGKILRAFKMRLFEEFPDQKDRDKQAIALLYVDSTDEMMPVDGRARADCRVFGMDASFTNSEFLNIRQNGMNVSAILDHIENYPTVRGIVDNVSAVRTAIGSLATAAGQKRRAGRLLFAASANAYNQALEKAITKVQAISGSDQDTHIHIFAGMAGGTGSGSIVDVIVQTRKKYPDAKIHVFAMIPERNLRKPDIDQGRYYPNGYAAMVELNALQAGRWKPYDVNGNGPIDLFSHAIKGVADGLTVYSNVNENGVVVDSLVELPKIVSDYVFARIFFINKEDDVNDDFIRAYNFENMDEFALEMDENGLPDPVTGELPVARTKKVNSFGIKRVMYPEVRVLKHIIYSVGESVLYQFKYNNWRENQGYANEARNRDFRTEYLNKENLQRWMLDLSHLTLENKVLPNDQEYGSFSEYWHDKAINWAEDAKRADCPLNELDNILNESYANFFRETGVENYYKGKSGVIPEISMEIRGHVEKELFGKWKDGDLSIVELQKVSKLLIERIVAIRTELEEAVKNEKINFEDCDNDRQSNVKEWSQLGLLQRMVGVGARRYADHQGILADYYTSKTMLVALEFAKSLAAKLLIDFQRLDEEISAFGMRISDAITETERLVTAQQKVNKGLENMKGAIIEVSEEEYMARFEADLRADKNEMPSIARQIRDQILPAEFKSFADLTSSITISDITDAFDTKLAEVVRTKHEERTQAQQKVLGLNILTQLQQKLRTDEDINAFAVQIVKQSGVYLNLSQDQVSLILRNNEVEDLEKRSASINKKVILVSIPSPEENTGLKRFADKLKAAFNNSFSQNDGRVTIKINTHSPRKDELSIISVQYCYPLRCVEWLKTYKERYERFLHTGNPAKDHSNAILLHSEGDGSQYPALFACEKPLEEIQHKPEPPKPLTPTVSVHLNIGGQNYGPYDWKTCEQLVEGKQLAAQTLVWMEGMSAWQPAGTVEVLKPLFAPKPVMPAPVGNGPVPPPVGGAGTAGPGIPPAPGPAPDPVVSVYHNVNGQNQGPYDWNTCKQLAQIGQFTAQSLVWMDGMPAWQPAGTVEVLKPLFTPKAQVPSPAGGGVVPPPVGGSIPPVFPSSL